MKPSLSSRFVVILLGLRLLLVSEAVGDDEASAETLAPRSEWPAVDVYIGSRREFARIPGVAIAVVQDDRVIYLRGYGRADADGRPVTPQIPFMLGSLSKSFTALAIMQLIEARKIDLDQPVEHYLPWFRVAEEQASRQITVRHLLNQTSGLSFRSGRLLLADTDASAAAIERHVRSLASMPLSSPPGTQYEYSNANYTTAGLIVEVVSGLPFEEYVRRNIFQPLAMRHSYASVDDAKRGGLATGHRVWFGWPLAAKNLPSIRGELPAGGLMASAENMAHWLIAHLNGGRYQDVSVLSPAGIEALHAPPAGGWYGMGWAQSYLGTHATLMHMGDTAGFHAQMVIVPSAKLGVVSLINVNSQIDYPPLTELAGGVASIILDETPPSPAHDPLATYIYVAIAAVILAQGVGFVWSLRLLRRAQSQNRAAGTIKGSTAVWAMAALAVDLAVVVVLAVVVPDWFETTFDAMLQAQPDASWPGLIAALFSLCWGPLRTLLLLRPLRSKADRKADTRIEK